MVLLAELSCIMYAYLVFQVKGAGLNPPPPTPHVNKIYAAPVLSRLSREHTTTVYCKFYTVSPFKVLFLRKDVKLEQRLNLTSLQGHSKIRRHNEKMKQQNK